MTDLIEVHGDDGRVWEYSDGAWRITGQSSPFPPTSIEAALLVEVVRLKERVAELERDARATYCAYCGHRIEVEDRDEAARQIAEHIRTCADHPMRAVEAEAAALRKRVADVEAAAEVISNHSAEMREQRDRLGCGLRFVLGAVGNRNYGTQAVRKAIKAACDSALADDAPPALDAIDGSSQRIGPALQPPAQEEKR